MKAEFLAEWAVLEEPFQRHSIFTAHYCTLLHFGAHPLHIDRTPVHFRRTMAHFHCTWAHMWWVMAGELMVDGSVRFLPPERDFLR